MIYNWKLTKLNPQRTRIQCPVAKRTKEDPMVSIEAIIIRLLIILQISQDRIRIKLNQTPNCRMTE